MKFILGPILISLLIAPAAFSASISCPSVIENLLNWKVNRIKPEITQKLEKRLPLNTFFISPEEVSAIKKELGLSERQLTVELIPLAKRMSRSSISNYKVGAVGLTESGGIILGTNIEFPGHFLNQTIHGEQFVFALAKLLEEKAIKMVAIGAAPCGHCRQFMNEAENGSEIGISVLGQKTLELKKLLPQSFGPKDLNSHEGLLTSKPLNLILKDNEPLGYLEQLALKAAQKSYSPYGKNAGGIALELSDGTVAWGMSLEVAAHNPSLTALQVALVDLTRKGKSFNQIRRAVLIEETSFNPSASQEKITEALLNTLSPRARLTTLKAYRLKE